MFLPWSLAPGTAVHSLSFCLCSTRSETGTASPLHRAGNSSTGTRVAQGWEGEKRLTGLSSIPQLGRIPALAKEGVTFQ